jgi:hypothetical protein
MLAILIERRRSLIVDHLRGLLAADNQPKARLTTINDDPDVTIIVVPETKQHLREKIGWTPKCSFKQRDRIFSPSPPTGASTLSGFR